MQFPKIPVRPVILCGGSGTRLWPVSRETFPKQFAPLLGERSTFQETLLRVQQKGLFGRPLVVTSEKHRFLAERQMAEIGVEGDLLLEPVARDSGPAILAASLFIQQHSPDALALILAADHLVLKPEAFRKAVADGCAAAQDGAIVTFGIVPTSPATGYGYIEQGEAIDSAVHKVARFVEKPDAATAVQYIAKGYLWNSGNFLFRPDIIVDEYVGSDAASVEAVRAALEGARSNLGVPVLDQTCFLDATKRSFDFAVMEGTRRAAVIPGDFGWSDIGGWDALWEMGDKDEGNNVALGDVTFHATTNTYASADDQLVATLGVDNLVVVATRDVVLVADKGRVADVKGVVENLKRKERAEAVHHARVYRPWGWYQTLELQDRFQVKRIVVYPGGKLSLQKHFHRSEHWVVVKGTARVTVQDKVTDLSENQSTFVPLGAVHRLENPGKIDVEMIEVQTGAYLGEDDIVRLEDVYARA